MLHLFPLYCGLLPLNILFFHFIFLTFFHRLSFSFLCIWFFFGAVFMSFNNLIIDFNTASDPTDVRKYISFFNKNQSSTEYYRVHDVTIPSKFVCLLISGFSHLERTGHYRLITAYKAAADYTIGRKKQKKTFCNVIDKHIVECLNANNKKQVFKMAAAAFSNHRFRLTPTVFPLLSNFS